MNKKRTKKENNQKMKRRQPLFVRLSAFLTVLTVFGVLWFGIYKDEATANEIKPFLTPFKYVNKSRNWNEKTKYDRNVVYLSKNTLNNQKIGKNLLKIGQIGLNRALFDGFSKFYNFLKRF